MIKQEQIDRLSHIDDFIAFLEEVRAVREGSIQQLHDRPVDSVQQLAGRILQCDDILKMGGYDEIARRRASR